MKVAPSFLFIAAVIGGCDPAADAFYAENVAALTIDPLEGPSEGGTRLAIQGVALCSDLVVTFDGVASPKVEVLSTEVALAEAPSHVIGTAQIALDCGARGSFQFPTPFRYYPSHIAFDPLIYFPTDKSYAFADLNADGLEELLTIERGDESLELVEVVAHFNLGNGGFAETPYLSFTFEELNDDDFELRFQTNDFTGDGINDLLLVARRSEEDFSSFERDLFLEMLLFKSELGHTSPEHFELRAPDGNHALAFTGAADFNGDGRFDISSIMGTSELRDYDELVFFEQDEAGGFVPYEFATPNLAFVANDFDQDGYSDVMNRSYVEEAGQTIVELEYYLGRATGGPEVITASITVGGLRDMPTLVFWNDDPLPDLLFLATGTGRLDSFEIALSTGIAQFEDRVTIDAACDHGCPAVFTVSATRLDLNRDGNGERIIETRTGGALLRHDGRLVALDQGESTFPSPVHLAEGEPPALIFGRAPVQSASLDQLGYRLADAPILARDVTAFCLGDLDGDGREDLITGRGADNAVEARMGRERGGFGAALIIGAPTEYFGLNRTCQVGDFNLDGKQDVLVDEGRYLINIDGAHFDDHHYVDILPDELWSIFPIEVQLGPNGDRLWAFQEPWNARVGLFQWRNGAFVIGEQAVIEYSIARANVLMPIDFNRDGILDVLAYEFLGENRALVAYRGEHAPGYPGYLSLTEDHRVAVPLTLFYPLVKTTDFDGDGWIDIVFDRSLYRNNGGRFEAIPFDPPAYPIVFQDACDIDGDDIRELLFTGDNGLLGWAVARNGLALETQVFGDTAFDAPYRQDDHNIACVDLDRDQFIDLVYINLFTNTMHRLRNTTH